MTFQRHTLNELLQVDCIRIHIDVEGRSAEPIFYKFLFIIQVLDNADIIFLVIVSKLIAYQFL